LATRKSTRPRNPRSRDQEFSDENGDDETPEIGFLPRLDDRLEALIQGVAQMNNTLALHSAMLQQILEAASQPPPKSQLAEALNRIGDILAEQQTALTGLQESLIDLPEQIADALATE